MSKATSFLAKLRSLVAADGSSAPVGDFFTTGDVKLTIKTAADSGWVLMNDGTIGNAASGATTRANADTAALYALLWNNTVNGDCAVSTGRGASAAADFAAGKTIALPKALGRALATYGAGSGLTARTMAKIAGTETHALTTAELATHTHAFSPHSLLGGDSTTGVADTGGIYYKGTALDIQTAASGSGDAHNNVQPTLFLNTMIKL